MAEPSFWDKKDLAQKHIEEVTGLRGKLQPLNALEADPRNKAAARIQCVSTSPGE